MARVALDALTAGLKLNKPVFNLNGVLLLREGEILTAKHLGILRTWGVREADVILPSAGDLANGAEAVPPDVAASAAREMERRFRRANASSDPTMAEIRRAATRRLEHRLMTTQAGRVK